MIEREAWLLKLRILISEVTTNGDAEDAIWCLSHYDVERRALDRMQWRGQADQVKRNEPEVTITCGEWWLADKGPDDHCEFGDSPFHHCGKPTGSHYICKCDCGAQQITGRRG